VNDADIFLAVVISICVTIFHLLESVALIIYLIVFGYNLFDFLQYFVPCFWQIMAVVLVFLWTISITWIQYSYSANLLASQLV